MKKAHFSVEEWETVATDRDAWRMMIKKSIETAEKERRYPGERAGRGEKTESESRKVRLFTNSRYR